MPRPPRGAAAAAAPVAAPPTASSALPAGRPLAGVVQAAAPEVVWVGAAGAPSGGGVSRSCDGSAGALGFALGGDGGSQLGSLVERHSLQAVDRPRAVRPAARAAVVQHRVALGVVVRPAQEGREARATGDERARRPTRRR